MNTNIVCNLISLQVVCYMDALSLSVLGCNGYIFCMFLHSIMFRFYHFQCERVTREQYLFILMKECYSFHIFDFLILFDLIVSWTGNTINCVSFSI